MHSKGFNNFISFLSILLIIKLNLILILILKNNKIININLKFILYVNLIFLLFFLTLNEIINYTK